MSDSGQDNVDQQSGGDCSDVGSVHDHGYPGSTDSRCDHSTDDILVLNQTESCRILQRHDASLGHSLGNSVKVKIHFFLPVPRKKSCNEGL